LPLVLLFCLALDWWSALPEGKTPQYVGRQSCVVCHASQAEKWAGSDHDRAMDLATPEFVLGDFDNKQLVHHGTTSKMYRRGDKSFVETEGPHGKLTEFHVKYVIGVRPLQQYLAELDGGRMQVLPVTWDTEQHRWFFANPDAPYGPDDPLHWTGSAQNWNHMCADCHTTNYAKNYDPNTDTHHHSFSEMDVSCEACHGPGSIHVELARAKSLFWDRRYGLGLAKLQERNTQLESCAPCHSRRRRIYPEFKPGDRFLDHYSLSLLDEHLYHADGQIDDEVYEYGSFLQSLMYRKRVRCTDCHDPHTTRVKFAGNRLCTQCHQAGKYDGQLHHRHKPESKGSLCVECHMPVKNYMVVDPRRDHSLRIPRPDLTVSIGTPNACNHCHAKEHETPQWAAQKIAEWYGPKRRDDPHYGEIIAAARQGKPNAREQLARLANSATTNAIVRATAVSLLATRYPIEESRDAIQRALGDRDELVRAAAVQAFGGWQASSYDDAQDLRRLFTPKLSDRSRLVRIEAARMALTLSPQHFEPSERAALAKAIEEYEASLLLDADQAGAHLSLGVLYSSLGDVTRAMNSYRTAMRLDPAVVGPRSNLAQLLDHQGQPDEARRLRLKEAELLKRDAELLPNSGLLQYQLGLMQYLLGREKEAEQSLLAATRLEPESTEFLLALTLLYEKQKRWPDALHAATELCRRAPDNLTFRQVLRNIEEGQSKGETGPSRPAGAQR
jgi:predicted CXXCH cytochrome family protein